MFETKPTGIYGLETHPHSLNITFVSLAISSAHCRGAATIKMLTRAFTLLLQALLTFTTLSLAAPTTPWYVKYHQPRVLVPHAYYEGLGLRRQTPLNPNAVRDVACLDTKA